MPARALIIGIESYPRAVDLAQTIPHATVGARQFFEWVTTTKGIAASDTYVCASGGTFAGANVFSTERERIVDAITALVAAGQDQTDHLFVYFSGHGYGFSQSLERRALDVLVASDFESAQRSGTKCLKLQEIQEKLYAVLGGEHHYYFIDACRTLIRDDEIDPIGIGRMLGRAAQKGRPTKYTLYSTAYGTAAAINSGFGPALIDGLHGRGTAKGYDGDGLLHVTFPLLAGYVQAQVRGQKLDRSQDGNGNGYIFEIVPIPTYTCAIEVAGASASDLFTAKLCLAGHPALADTKPFTGRSLALPFTPGNLLLELSDGGRPLTRVEPPPGTNIDFWDDCAVVFRKPSAVVHGEPPVPAAPAPAQPLPDMPADAAPPEHGRPAPSPTPPRATVPLAPPPAPDGAARLILPALGDLHAVATNLRTGETHTLGPNETRDVQPGPYQLAIKERGETISRSVTMLAAGADRHMASEPFDAIRAGIVSAVGGDPSRGVVAFSETLGEIANRDLGLWLTILGASRVVDDPSHFSKLKKLPLADITTFRPGSTAVYAIGASAEGDIPNLRAGASTGRGQAVTGLPGVWHCLIEASPGAQLLTAAFAESTRIFSSFCLPDRLTLLVCSPGSRGQLHVNQFILPMFHLRAHSGPADPARGWWGPPPPLSIVRAAYYFQEQFGRKREIRPAASEAAALWASLRNGTWLDPIMSLIAFYELVRRASEQERAAARDVVAGRLEHAFPAIPDTAALAALLGLDRPMPAGPPLVREGLLAFPGWENRLPLPAGRQDFTHIWTAWSAPAEGRA